MDLRGGGQTPSKLKCDITLSGVEQNNTLALRDTKGTAEQREACDPVCLVLRGRGEGARYAFTLAEVLITLGIIGVVAAMTLPTLVNKYQEQVTVTKVKKFYSVMNQALLMAIKDHGYVDEWSFYEADETEGGTYVSDKLSDYLKPYLKISKYCGAEAGCIASGKYKLLTGSDWINYDAQREYSKMILADGSYLWIRIHNLVGTSTVECANSDANGTANVCGLIWTDINGKQPPNVIGKDVFTFFIMKNRIIPHTTEGCKDTQGWGCAAYILQNGDMKYLH